MTKVDGVTPIAKITMLPIQYLRNQGASFFHYASLSSLQKSLSHHRYSNLSHSMFVSVQNCDILEFVKRLLKGFKRNFTAKTSVHWAQGERLNQFLFLYAIT